MKGLILEENFSICTDINVIFQSLGLLDDDYNWLISNIESYDLNLNDSINNTDKKFLFLSKEKLIEQIINKNINFVWAVFSAIPKHVTLTEIENGYIPYADGNLNIWTNPEETLHDLAHVEIIFFDSSFIILRSKQNEIYHMFKEAFPTSMEIHEYLDTNKNSF